MQIRFADTRDLAALERIEADADALLIEALHAANWPAATSGPARAAMPGFILVIAASDGDAPLGFAHTLEIDGFAHLEQLSVLPAAGRQGLGRRLVEESCAEARRRGYREISLCTFADIPWNAPFYASCGFVESTPRSAFHLRLVAAEAAEGLPAYGRRVQMTRAL